MASSTSEKTPDRRARIRENQRRSRARKQEYTQELEQKLARHEAAASQNDIQQRIAIQQLQAENEKLRHLLYALGAQPATINAYLSQNDDPSVSRKVAIPRMMESQSPQGSNCTPTSSEKCEPTQSQNNTCQASNDDGNEATTIQPAPFDRGFTENSSSDHADDQQPTTSLSPPISATDSTAVGDAPLCYPAKQEEPNPRGSPGVISDCECNDQDADSWPKDESRFGTTLCAVAGELIRQYNTLGVDLTDIKKRLWTGFRKEMAAGEGCRVQNQLLFEVLNEISGNLS